MAPGAMDRHLVTNAQCCGSSYFKPLNAAISHGGATGVSPMAVLLGVSLLGFYHRCLIHREAPVPLLCSRLLAQMPRVEERLLSPWGGSFWSSSPSVAGSKGVLFGLFRGLWGRRPSLLLAQMPNSQGGSIFLPPPGCGGRWELFITPGRS